MDCHVKGSLGALWAHFIETHARHAKQTHPAETNIHRPLKFTRTEQGSSAPSFQTATSSMVTQSASVCPTTKSSAVSFPISPVSSTSSALPVLPMSQPSGMPLPAMSAFQSSSLSASSALQLSATSTCRTSPWPSTCVPTSCNTFSHIVCLAATCRTSPWPST
ncbi:hypothetical protein C8R42DRAFT_716231 [Lentinula raphanica]|nr:hypothetical protein C8R42DRAFT_716231 [Lentinula raphanica]